MAIKLYQWDVSQKEELTHPTTFSGDYVIRWFQNGYVSMTTEFATLFNTMNNDLVVKSNADGVAAVKLCLKGETDNEKIAAIRREYSVNDEFFALRTDDTAIKNRIAAIIAGIETERDSWLDVS